MSAGPAEAMAVGATDPTHEVSLDTTWWTTVNTAEAMPGVMTPLSWTGFWDEPLETGMRGALVDMGVLRTSEIAYPAECSDRFTAIFHGRVAGNLERLCMVGDRMPGTSGEAVELQLFGTARADAVRAPTSRRYPAIAGRLPLRAAILPRVLEKERLEADAWWRGAVFGEQPDPERARALLVEARDRFRKYMRAHVTAAFLCQGAYDRVGHVAAALGKAGAETELVRGYGGMVETAITTDLWDVSRKALTLEAFLSRHGYHGPHEGELSARSWRECVDPLRAVIERYRSMPNTADPREVERRTIEQRHRLEAELLGAAHGRVRLEAKAALWFARRHVPGREVGKSSFLRCLDVGRFAARIVGADLASRGVLADPEDVFALTLDEVLRPNLSGIGERAARRQAQREQRLLGRLPATWAGNPEMLVLDDSTGDDAAVTGLAASAGVYEGTARVVADPLDAELDEGEVLVCEVTDPSWAALFVLAGALVTDIGGPISHGAIVAREMGLPAVVNTGNGTRVIRDGDRVRVDGAAGTVDILERA